MLNNSPHTDTNFCGVNNLRYGDLCMKGKIRTEQKCPKCREKFQRYNNGIFCSGCMIQPDRFFIDIYQNKKRLRIFKDHNGEVLDSWQRSERLLGHIRWEIDNKRFDPDRYIKTKSDSYQFKIYSENWLDEQKIRYEANEISYGTFYKNKRILEQYIIDYFGLDDIRQITTRNVKDFNLHLSKIKVKGGNVMSAKYREFIIGLLRQIFYDGLKSGDLNRSQVPVFPTVETQQKFFQVLSEDEQDEILSKIPEYNFPIFHTILTYGIRPSEVRALKRDCILGNYDQIVLRRTFTRNNRLRENPKENRWRIISLLDETRTILKSLEVSFTGFVFINKWDRPYSQSYLNNTWNEACTEAKYNYIPLKNASRHSLGTKLAMQGYGENIIAKVLGHADTKVTKHYTRYASESLKPFFKREKNKKAIVKKLAGESSKK